MSRVALFFGGPGNEAQVSITSATNIVKHFDYNQHKLVLIYWHKDNLFYKLDKIEDCKRPQKKQILEISNFKKNFDLALLMTHGRYGEDGVLQGMLESQKIIYSGSGVLSSALCMDKVVFKKLMSAHDIPQLNFFVLDYELHTKLEINKIIQKAKLKLNYPIYIKPANSGSSLGVTKLDNWRNLNKAIKEARLHDHKIILEQGLIKPREIEVAILGNRDLIVSCPGELKLEQDFYDYAEKYEKGRAKMLIPAKITPRQANKINQLCQIVYRLADCRGFARLDFFLKNNKIYLNEINTLPGFTDISMYPMLMKQTGFKYRDIIRSLIKLAINK